MTFLGDLQELVELQSPSEDLDACARVVELAVEIAARNLPTPAQITEAGGRPVLSKKDLEEVLNSAAPDRGLLLLIERGGSRTFAILKP